MRFFKKLLEFCFGRDEMLFDWGVALDVINYKRLEASPLMQKGDRLEGKAFNSIWTVFYSKRGIQEEITLQANWVSSPLHATFEDGRLVRWRNRNKDLPISVSDNIQAVQFLMLVRNLFPIPRQSSRAQTAVS